MSTKRKPPAPPTGSSTDLPGAFRPFKGVIMDTASISSLIAVAAAREALNLRIREEGMAGRSDLLRLTMYTSEQSHSSIEKGGIVLGIGQQNIRKIEVDAEFRVKPDCLANAAHVLPDGLRTLGEIKLAQGDHVAAETFIRQSLEQAQANEDRYLEAYGRRALARVQAVCAQQSASRVSLEKAIELFEALGLDQEVTRSQSMQARLSA